MTLPTDPQTAVILERIDSLRKDVAELSTRVEGHGAIYVSRAEFEAWRTSTDREIRDLKAADARPPIWPTIMSAVTTVAMAAVTVITLLGR